MDPYIFLDRYICSFFHDTNSMELAYMYSPLTLKAFFIEILLNETEKQTIIEVRNARYELLSELETDQGKNYCNN